MKDTPLSNCERDFLLKAIQEKKRLDGRQTYDYRRMKITFGTDYGCCFVDLGKTRVMAQVSCELVAPKENRPNEGIMFFNIELSPMASPAFEQGRPSELSVKLNRQLERCLRNSKCIDTESLCVVSGEKVWQIRVDVHMLNHDGNLMDAASIAAITALCHFRHPDVSIQGDEVTVYSPEERDPIPLSIYHMPISVSFSFFLQGTYLLVDPCEREERVMDGLLMIAMNKHREICSIQSSGGIMLLKEQVMRCSKIASVKVSEITELITKALENDRNARKAGGRCGFAESMPQERITALKKDETPMEMMDVSDKVDDIVMKGEAPPQTYSLPRLNNNSTYLHCVLGLGSIYFFIPSYLPGVSLGYTVYDSTRQPLVPLNSEFAAPRRPFHRPSRHFQSIQDTTRSLDVRTPQNCLGQSCQLFSHSTVVTISTSGLVQIISSFLFETRKICQVCQCFQRMSVTPNATFRVKPE